MEIISEWRQALNLAISRACTSIKSAKKHFLNDTGI
jgi:hypothetical protein